MNWLCMFCQCISQPWKSEMLLQFSILNCSQAVIYAMKRNNSGATSARISLTTLDKISKSVWYFYVVLFPLWWKIQRQTRIVFELISLFGSFSFLLDRNTLRWYNRLVGTHTVELTYRCVQSVLCESAAWLRPAQHFSKSGDGQQWGKKMLLRHKAAPHPSPTLPVIRLPLAAWARADSWLLVFWLREKTATQLHSVLIGCHHRQFGFIQSVNFFCPTERVTYNTWDTVSSELFEFNMWICQNCMQEH